MRNDTDFGFGPWWLPPPAVMRSALLCALPCALVWSIGGSVGWSAVLGYFGTTWPPALSDPMIGVAVLAVAALFGAVCGVIGRMVLWLHAERRIDRAARRRRPVRVKAEVKTDQNWDEAEFLPSRDCPS